MKTFKFILGVVLVIASLAAIGGGAVLTSTGIMSRMNSQHDFGMTMFGVTAGIVPGIILGCLAWWAFASARRTP